MFNIKIFEKTSHRTINISNVTSINLSSTDSTNNSVAVIVNKNHLNITNMIQIGNDLRIVFANGEELFIKNFFIGKNDLVFNEGFSSSSESYYYKDPSNFNDGKNSFARLDNLEALYNSNESDSTYLLPVGIAALGLGAVGIALFNKKDKDGKKESNDNKISETTTSNNNVDSSNKFAFKYGDKFFDKEEKDISKEQKVLKYDVKTNQKNIIKGDFEYNTISINESETLKITIKLEQKNSGDNYYTLRTYTLNQNFSEKSINQEFRNEYIGFKFTDIIDKNKGEWFFNVTDDMFREFSQDGIIAVKASLDIIGSNSETLYSSEEIKGYVEFNHKIPSKYDIKQNAPTIEGNIIKGTISYDEESNDNPIKLLDITIVRPQKPVLIYKGENIETQQVDGKTLKWSIDLQSSSLGDSDQIIIRTKVEQNKEESDILEKSFEYPFSSQNTLNKAEEEPSEGIIQQARSIFFSGKEKESSLYMKDVIQAKLDNKESFNSDFNSFIFNNFENDQAFNLLVDNMNLY